MPVFIGVEAVTYNGTSFTITKPAGTAENDVMLMVCYQDALVASPTLSGWISELGPVDQSTNARGNVLRKVAGAGEPGSYTFACGDSQGTAYILTYRGGDAAAPINQKAGGVTADTSTPPSPSITPTVNGCMIVAAIGTDQTTTRLPISPDTSPVANERVEVESAVFVSAYGQDYLQGTAAAISLDATTTGVAEWIAFTVAIAPSTELAPTKRRFPLWGKPPGS